ncbi:MAG: hypothetical protein EAZ14_01960 [Runella slithyformis]|nr:MAG: hypothetical protein EAZ14_01960 [Runella slithyformis]
MYPILEVVGYKPEFKTSLSNGSFSDSVVVDVKPNYNVFVKAVILRRGEVGVQVENSSSSQEFLIFKERTDYAIFDIRTSGKTTIRLNSKSSKVVVTLHIVQCPKNTYNFDKLSAIEKAISVGRMAETNFFPIREKPVELGKVYSLKFASEISERSSIRFSDNAVDDTKIYIYPGASIEFIATIKSPEYSGISESFSNNLIKILKEKEGVPAVFYGEQAGLDASNTYRETKSYAPYNGAAEYLQMSGNSPYMIKTYLTDSEKTKKGSLSITISRIDTIINPVKK